MSFFDKINDVAIVDTFKNAESCEQKQVNDVYSPHMRGSVCVMYTC